MGGLYAQSLPELLDRFGRVAWENPTHSIVATATTPNSHRFEKHGDASSAISPNVEADFVYSVEVHPEVGRDARDCPP